jgi:hypothetical protein
LAHLLLSLPPLPMSLLSTPPSPILSLPMLSS